MIMVTGVSGALGGLVLAGLRALDGVEVVGGSRTGDGEEVRRVDFDDPGTLAEGFHGVDVLVFVSAGYAEDDVVIARHGAVLKAAAAAGVRQVVYTSLAGSGELLSIALAHRWTEARLAEAPFGATVLRNGLYAEIPAGLALAGAGPAAESGVFEAAFGAGRVSVVAREDLADVAVRVAAETERDLADGRVPRHAGRTYELEGPTAIGGAEIAELLGEALGRPVEYRAVGLGVLRRRLGASGLEPYQAGHTLSLFANAGAGTLEATGGQLAELLEHEPRDVRELVVAGLGLRSGSIRSGD